MASPAQTPAAPEFKPHVFGKFFLLQRLAVGGMAEIFRAKVAGAEGFEKELVVKRILPARSQDHGFIQMLVNEAKLTVQLTHNNVAQIYECGSIDGTYFISMELVNGVSLKDMMVSFARSGTPITPESAIFLVLQLLQGLEYAHKKTDAQGNPLRIIHCDVSPDNALVSWQGEVKLLDFGIARAATGLSNYKEGMLMGKLGYVAPEQASLDRPWDHRVDVFAAGIILYELLTKQKPFQRAVDVETLIQSRQGKVVPPSSIDERLPRELDAIVLRALAADPDDRYPDARSFADALVDVLFPTPHSAIQDHLGRQMHTVYAERITRQRAARAHDALVMKVLRNVAEQQAAAVYDSMAKAETTGSLPPPPLADLGTHSIDIDLDRASPRAAPLGPERVRTVRVGAGRAIAAGVLAGAVVAAAGYAAAPWLRDGTLVVTSTPPGAQVTLDGRAVPGTTPLVVDGVRLSEGHRVEASLPAHRSATAEVRAEPGRLARTVHLSLSSALGSFTVVSEPPGAEIAVDGKTVGRTPFVVTGVRVDERHRVDLTLPGHEIDQFVVLPEKDGDRFVRRLVPRARGP
ncbi:MAG TPA: serine/threonine-protein kinase, partial [Anaeromyxobacteraceae bacterium]|nr:serine/threonine-protein kinase [Anaeromyxobacteraceae bacterium]